MQTAHGAIPFLLQSAMSETQCVYVGAGPFDPPRLVDMTAVEGSQGEWLFDGKRLRPKILATHAIYLDAVRLGSQPAQEWCWTGKLFISVLFPTACIQLNVVTSPLPASTRCVLGDVRAGKYPPQEWTMVFLIQDTVVTPKTGIVPLTSLSTMQVYQLLSALEFDQYKQRLWKASINGHALACCATVDELVELGIDLKLKARSLWQSLQSFQAAGVPVALFEHAPRPKCAYRFQSVKHPALCLQLQSGTGASRNGDRCILGTTKATLFPAQAWIFEGKLIYSAKDKAKCIHLNEHGKTFNGDICHLWEVERKKPWANQEWLFDGKLIRSVKDPTKCIRLQSGDKPHVGAGDFCHLWDIVYDGPFPAQEWTLVRDEHVRVD
ncbi:hypothetical protein SDRG_11657 [Saprolegnia diclina VS20]|uniref:SAM domain-containing protein n=1 Tax=Saprolegnia diclina (strain VS20) TaxID=1156394 RepID=T0RL06_SAPDV|nr:hypothetical protein SDRG_11657 [Saprolegnia diclina VS20]EQC30602.1 hypothetical protein SDRG_11657 [Saprolegnia diclina VS20]|eukprot:XP_008615928.1 hypothetical protein SDRG_11657 [Saprolegnia diclina VS20]